MYGSILYLVNLIEDLPGATTKISSKEQVSNGVELQYKSSGVVFRARETGKDMARATLPRLYTYFTMGVFGVATTVALEKIISIITTKK
ncbi:MAG: hypothetical protein A2W22_03235 [Candidatus Levybacteria bacterium RBG_16_35_11]|nr:MAG: hypothetical protein A2W22_03235 [Candidatus Levybacteria bacterium RBG_16_35_11]